MLATPGRQPTGADWVFEVKLDGIRLICRADETGIRLLSRNGRDLTAAFPELTTVSLPPGTVLDGELIAARDDGVPTLQHIAARIHRTRPDRRLMTDVPVRYVVFDAPIVGGTDLSDRPLHERRVALQEVLPDDPNWHLSDWFDDGAALWEATAEQGFEGVVAKRRNSPYRAGVRSRDWIKTAHRTITDAVVVGWRPETGSRARVGALVLAQADPGSPEGRGWIPLGSVGSGMTQVVSDALSSVLPELARDAPPPRWPDEPRTQWVEPALVVSVQHLGRTQEGRLRHPVIVALRPDLTAAELLTDAVSPEND